MVEALHTTPKENLETSPLLAFPKKHDTHEDGRASERKVAKALRKIPTIKSVLISEENGPDDVRGKDLTIVFKEDANIDTVWVQVKTSEEGARTYRRKVYKRLEKQNILMTPEEWMISNRIIVLVANDHSKAQIRESFSMQLEAINNYADLSNPLPAFSRAAIS